jgi:hypothetical protein
VWELEVCEPPHKLASALGLTTNPFTGVPEQHPGELDSNDGVEQEALALWMSLALSPKAPAFTVEAIRKLAGLTADASTDAARVHKQFHDLIAAAIQAPATAIATLSGALKGRLVCVCVCVTRLLHSLMRSLAVQITPIKCNGLSLFVRLLLRWAVLALRAKRSPLPQLGQS